MPVSPEWILVLFAVISNIGAGITVVVAVRASQTIIKIHLADHEKRMVILEDNYKVLDKQREDNRIVIHDLRNLIQNLIATSSLATSPSPARSFLPSD